MQTDKTLIIQLIQQDLRHNQLTGGLRKTGLHTDLHNLELLTVVARFMGIGREEVSDEWGEIYVSFLEKALDYPITERGNELLPLAEKCYTLLACKQIEYRSDATDDE